MCAELDPPLVESGKKKQSRRFASVRRGYDPTQVDEYLTAIASRVEALEKKLREHRVTAEVSPEAADPAPVPSPSAEEDGSERYTARIARLGEVGVREVEAMLAEAKAEAATILSEGRGEADRIMRDAQEAAKRSVEEARSFLNQVEGDARVAVSGVADRRRQMIEELRIMQERLMNVAQELGRVINPGPGS